ncbi:beta-xylosidase [Paraburkholderia sp. PREW-6R]|uniref:beta-xylosidase n=1 Tax=Paraburkholderia sp. PREW-6R TaxID=3141544 RepID=UPI0031F56E4E
MNSPLLIQSRARPLHEVAVSRATARIAVALAGVAFFASSNVCLAQITQGSGSSQQENRTSAMGSKPDPSASFVHESNTPQTKDGASGGTRGKTASKGHDTQGAGGFNNGLYGTGAGSNK